MPHSGWRASGAHIGYPPGLAGRRWICGCYGRSVIGDLAGVSEPTVAVRVLDELRRCGVALDDDELAHRLGISPRQTINQVRRGLERAGRLRRYVGSAGKIVNDLHRGDGQVRPATTSAELAPGVLGPVGGGALPAAGDCREQRDAERVMLGLLGERFGVVLKPRRIALEDGIRVEVDGPMRSCRSWLRRGRIRDHPRSRRSTRCWPRIGPQDVQELPATPRVGREDGKLSISRMDTLSRHERALPLIKGEWCGSSLVSGRCCGSCQECVIVSGRGQHRPSRREWRTVSRSTSKLAPPYPVASTPTVGDA
jgi:hypothetical protein